MSEQENMAELEVEDFADELSDEMLDRDEVRYCCISCMGKDRLP